MKDIFVNTFECIDFTRMSAPLITISVIPESFPHAYVARLYNWDQPTNIVMSRQTIEDIYKGMPKSMVRMLSWDWSNKSNVVETWG